MTEKHAEPAITELRVAITAAEFERLASFYLEGLGLSPSQAWPQDQGRSVVLDLGSATLELFDEEQATAIDRVEVGERVSGPVRFALRVPDLDAALARLKEHGATIVHPPVITPWGDRNARVQDPEGMQVTLFESPDS